MIYKSKYSGEEIDDRLDAISNKQDIFQYTTMPTASFSNVGEIYQYIGENTGDLQKGYFYECIEDSGSYFWVNIPIC